MIVYLERSAGGDVKDGYTTVPLKGCWSTVHPSVWVDEPERTLSVQFRGSVHFIAPQFLTRFEWRRGPKPTYKRKWNEFEHFKRVFEFDPSNDVRPPLVFRLEPSSDPNFDQGREYWTTDAARTMWYSGEYGDYGRFDNGLPALSVLDDEGIEQRTVDADNQDELVSVALQRLWPTVKGELSLVNSIVELKDFITLKQTINNVRTAIETFSLKGFKRSRSLRDHFIHTGADNFLQWKFNLAPLISDILSIGKAVATSGKRIDALLAGEGKTVTRHWTKPLLEDAYVSFEESSTYSQNPNGWADYEVWEREDTVDSDFHRVSGPWNLYPSTRMVSSRRIVSYSPAMFHAQIRCTYEYDALQREFAHRFALLDSLGVNLDPSIIWNAIPWSFVLDWVLGVGKLLSSYTFENMSPRVRVLRYQCSVRRERSITVKSCAINGGITTEYTHPVVRETSYKRFNVPLVGSLLTASGLSPVEIALGSSLVLTRKKKSIKRRTLLFRRHLPRARKGSKR